MPRTFNPEMTGFDPQGAHNMRILLLLLAALLPLTACTVKSTPSDPSIPNTKWDQYWSTVKDPYTGKVYRCITGIHGRLWCDEMEP